MTFVYSKTWRLRVVENEITDQQVCIFEGNRRSNPLKCWKDTKGNFTRQLNRLPQQFDLTDSNFTQLPVAFQKFGEKKGYI